MTSKREKVEEAFGEMVHPLAVLGVHGNEAEKELANKIAGLILAHNRGETQPASGEPVAEAWRSMDTAPKDGTMLRLLVEFTDNDVEDSEGPHPTIGSNSFEYSDIDEWMFAGWDWQQDQFCKGEGRPIGWLPMEYAAPPAAAHGYEAVRIKLPEFIRCSEEMHECGKSAVERAIEDQCFGRWTQFKVYFEAAIEEWLSRQEDAAMRAQAGEGGE